MITIILILLCVHRTVLYLCTVLCFALSLFLYACMHVHFSYLYSTRIQRVYAAVHSYSYICLLRGVGCSCSLGVIAYVLLYMRSLPSSSTVMYLVRLSYGCHAEVNFDTSLSLRMLSFHYCFHYAVFWFIY